ncbi:MULTISPECIES: type II toxin-antitoxin system RelE/ParE family toxin [Alphaproteobacteria]|uniref:type II toxin-antitoxin system RelE/ParE family toxin n=1 Tax=Alphaproteobacteria TaxID=28211 RepID=UPI00329A452F
MAYKLTRKAEEDIITVYQQGVVLFGAAQAETYHARLEQAFDFLSANPRAARERMEITPPVRCHPLGVHIVIYLIEDNGDVLILRVRHSREDWAADPV